MISVVFTATEAALGSPTLLVDISKAARSYVEELRDSSPRLFTGERLFNLQKKLSEAVDAAFNTEEADEDKPW